MGGSERLSDKVEGTLLPEQEVPFAEIEELQTLLADGRDRGYLTVEAVAAWRGKAGTGLPPEPESRNRTLSARRRTPARGFEAARLARIGSSLAPPGCSVERPR